MPNAVKGNPCGMMHVDVFLKHNDIIHCAGYKQGLTAFVHKSHLDSPE